MKYTANVYIEPQSDRTRVEVIIIHEPFASKQEEIEEIMDSDFPKDFDEMKPYYQQNLIRNMYVKAATRCFEKSLRKTMGVKI